MLQYYELSFLDYLKTPERKSARGFYDCANLRRPAPVFRLKPP